MSGRHHCGGVTPHLVHNSWDACGCVHMIGRPYANLKLIIIIGCMQSILKRRSEIYRLLHYSVVLVWLIAPWGLASFPGRVGTRLFGDSIWL